MKRIAITELPTFERKACKLFQLKEQEELKEFLARYPDKGSVIPGLGGIRKLRWAAGGKGKRGGARVIYFYYIKASHIYLMTCYGKNQQEDIAPDEKRQLRKIIDDLLEGDDHGTT